MVTQPLKDRVDYLDAQKEAMTAKIGLWVESDPVAPWDWRKSKKL